MTFSPAFNTINTNTNKSKLLKIEKLQNFLQKQIDFPEKKVEKNEKILKEN